MTGTGRDVAVSDAASMTGCPCGCQSVPRFTDDPDCLLHSPLTRGLADALDHLDAVGLCACWTAPRSHIGRAA